MFVLLVTLVPGINDSLEELDQSRDQTVKIILLCMSESCAGVSKNYWDLNGYFWDMQTLMMWLSWKRSHWTNRSVGTVNISGRDLRGMKTSQKIKSWQHFWVYSQPSIPGMADKLLLSRNLQQNVVQGSEAAWCVCPGHFTCTMTDLILCPREPLCEKKVTVHFLMPHQCLSVSEGMVSRWGQAPLGVTSNRTRGNGQ